MKKTIRNLHLRELPSWVFDEREIPDEFVAFVFEKVLPQIKLSGYKIEAQERVLCHIVHNAILTGIVASCVADVRSTHEAGVRMRVKLWDQLDSAGLVRTCFGSETSGKLTRYMATAKLLKKRKRWELNQLLNLELSRNSKSFDAPSNLALVCLHSGRIDLATGEPLPDDEQKQPISFLEQIKKDAQRSETGEPHPQAIQNGLDHFKAIEDLIENINRSNLEHSWQAFKTNPDTGKRHVYPPNPCLRQIHVGKFFRAVRLYSWSPLSGQNIRKEERQSILIDNEPVSEFDYSGMATRMLYHRKRIDPDPERDIYRPDAILPKFYRSKHATENREQVVRDLVKRATNVCWNVESRSAANSSVGKLLADHERTKLLKRVLRFEGIGPVDVVQRIFDVHPDLTDSFFTGVGLDLMTKDGVIMLHILRTFADAKKPALGIHDSILCKTSDSEFALQTMTAVYRDFCRFDPVVKKSF